MKFIFEDFDINRYKQFFKIFKNSSGNYCAYHLDDDMSYFAELMSGRQYVAPFCWSGRKKHLENALNELCEYYPSELKSSFLNKNLALILGVKSYGNPLNHWKQIDKSSVQDIESLYKDS